MKVALVLLQELIQQLEFFLEGSVRSHQLEDPFAVVPSTVGLGVHLKGFKDENQLLLEDARFCSVIRLCQEHLYGQFPAVIRSEFESISDF